MGKSKLMLRGILGHPYLDLYSYVDLTSFDKLHSEICRAFVLGKNFAGNGNLQLEKYDQENVNLDAYNGDISPVWLMYEKYLKLSNDDPIKVAGEGLNEEQLILYIKYAFGAYNPWHVYNVFDKIDEKRVLSPIHHLFPNLITWIDNLDIFSNVTRAYFLLIEQDGISVEHCDPSPHPDIPREFIHIKSCDSRPFYVREYKNSEKIYMNSRVTYFNDQDWHGGEASKKTTYSLRIDGIFTETFRKQLKGKAGAIR
jgi:hypothetical protein|tara:strand:+ start:9266 stop:10030 length:765 start_codon:yes stop_codon:yes gene_type:complete